MNFSAQMEQQFNDIFSNPESGFKVIFTRHTVKGNKQKERKFNCPTALQRWMNSNLDTTDGTIALNSLYDFDKGRPLVATNCIEAKEYLTSLYGE